MVVALVAVVTGVAGREIYLKTPVKSSDVIKEITLDGVETLRVGIASAWCATEKTTEADHLRVRLELLKEQKINMLIFPGDFADYASKYSYSSFLKIIEDVFLADDASISYMLFVM